MESGASSSTGNERTQEGEAEVAYATASAAASPAGDAAVAEAFWKVFADDVMEHLVWPAVHKGHINAAPKADVDHPEWWERGIFPILEHPRVYMLHVTGGKKAATSCWTFVCDQLANHVFVEAAAGEAFTQKNVEDFILAAGYAMPACSRSSSGSQDDQVVARAKGAKVSVSLTEVSKRDAYAEVEQLARVQMEETNWMSVRSLDEGEDILRAYQVYADEGRYLDICLSLSAVVTEVRLTMQVFAQRKLWPTWLVRSNDKALENMPETDDAYVDAGNEVWEVVVSLMGLSSAIGSRRQQQRCNYNLRGNVLGRLLEWLYDGMQTERAALSPKRRRERRGW